MNYVRRFKKATRRIGLGMIVVLLGSGSPLAFADSHPSLFFYTAPYRYPDGHILDSPQTVSFDQTTEFEAIPEMSGVVIIIYWSTLCPTEHCDFSLVDRIIDYWSQRGKKVVLSVATIGYPIEAVPNRQEIIGAVPKWVLAKIRTYQFPSRVLGSGSPDTSNRYVFPDFRDPEFLRLSGVLVRELASRYDGNPTIAQVRISAGLMGEENPIVGPLVKPMSGYEESEWIEYCRAIVKEYESDFKKSELEFDISRFPWIRAIGNAREKSLVEGFMADLRKQGVFVAWNGLQSQADDLVGAGSDSRDGRAQAVRFLQEYKRQGGHVGLEALGPLTNPRMGTIDKANADKIAHLISVVSPDRVVFFHDVARAVKLRTDADHHAVELLREIGYEAKSN